MGFETENCKYCLQYPAPSFEYALWDLKQYTKVEIIERAMLRLNMPYGIWNLNLYTKRRGSATFEYALWDLKLCPKCRMSQA